MGGVFQMGADENEIDSLVGSREVLELLLLMSIRELEGVLNEFEAHTGISANEMGRFEGAHLLIRFYMMWKMRDPGVLEELVEKLRAWGE